MAYKVLQENMADLHDRLFGWMEEVGINEPGELKDWNKLYPWLHNFEAVYRAAEEHMTRDGTVPAYADVVDFAMRVFRRTYPEGKLTPVRRKQQLDMSDDTGVRR